MSSRWLHHLDVKKPAPEVGPLPDLCALFGKGFTRDVVEQYAPLLWQVTLQEISVWANDPDPDVRLGAIKVLLFQNDVSGAVDLLMMLSKDKTKPDANGRYPFEVYGGGTNYEVEVRVAAVCALGLMDTPRATEGLVAALSDRNKHVREEAGRGLRRKADPSTAMVLLKAGAKEDEMGPWFEYRGTLVEMGDKALPALLEAAQSEDSDLRGEVLEVAARKPREELWPYVVAGATRSGNEGRAASVALGYYNRPESSRLLAEIAKHANSRTLLELPGSFSKLSNPGPEAFAVLNDLLGHEEPQIRAEAAMAVVRCAWAVVKNQPDNREGGTSGENSLRNYVPPETIAALRAARNDNRGVIPHHELTEDDWWGMTAPPPDPTEEAEKALTELMSNRSR